MSLKKTYIPNCWTVAVLAVFVTLVTMRDAIFQVIHLQQALLNLWTTPGISLGMDMETV